MTAQHPAARGVDSTKPNVARIYDYFLGGKDNFEVDREAAKKLLAAQPQMAAVVRDNRSFIGRAVRYMAAEAGIRQFIDLGGGLPTRTNVHEMAQRIAPEARVVYIDNDPVVWSHGQALLADGKHVTMVLADLRRPGEVLEHPDLQALLDLTRPVAVLCACVLHFVGDAEHPHRIIAEYRDRITSGSFLMITHGTTGNAQTDPTGMVAKVTDVYRQASAQMHVRSLADIQRFFEGFDLIDPGVVWMAAWRPDPDVPTGPAKSLIAGVGRKPLCGVQPAREWWMRPSVEVRG
jgi:O-methyltransferase involved in polyketide biosynthesis